MPQSSQKLRIDPRTARSRKLLREALAAEIRSTGDLGQVTATAVAERAGLTRRTFYSHYHDVPELVVVTEDAILSDLEGLIRGVASAHLDDIYDRIAQLQPAPGSIELLTYCRDNGELLTALLGDGGDPAFAGKIENVARDAVTSRALDGIDARALGSFFDYYLEFAVSAEIGVLLRWLSGGMREDVAVMARLMTMLMFVRPGDLYGNPINFNVPALGLALMNLKENDND